MSFFKNKRIFLDYAGGQDNPSAIHAEGRAAKRELEEARTKVARLLRAGVRDVIFTSGGTESDNLAVLGVFEYATTLSVNKPHIIISNIEHPAVLESAREAERRGARLSIVEVDEEYRINPIEVMKLVNEETILISISLAHGVTGAIQPIQKLTRLVREYRKKNQRHFLYVHTDASQALPTLDVCVDSLGVDLMTLDASKFSGPKCGLLVVRPQVSLQPILFGGGQERGLRSGTQDVRAAVECARLLEEAIENRQAEAARLGSLRTYAREELQRVVPEAVVHGALDPKEALPNILAVSVPGVLSEFLAVALDEKGIAVSSGSACTSEGDTDDAALLRFSFGRTTSKSDIDLLIENFSLIVRRAKMGA